MLLEKLKIPEFPDLKNNEMRKAFINEHIDWPVWFEVPEADEVYYRYDLTDGCSIVICEFKQFIEWRARYIGEKPEVINKRYFLIKPDSHYLHDCSSNESGIINHLKKLRKR